MYHLDYLQEIVLCELGECFGEFLHVDVAVCFGAFLFGFGWGGAVVGGFACGTGFFEDFEEIAFGVAECLGMRMLDGVRRSRGGVWTYDCVGTLISLLLEIEIVLQRCVSSLGATQWGQGDGHVELSPSFLLDREGSLLDSYFTPCQSFTFMPAHLSQALFPPRV